MGHHDLFFKQTFSIRENAVDFVKHTLPPELADGIDFSTESVFRNRPLLFPGRTGFEIP